MQTTANRADGDLQDASDGVIIKVFDFSQHQNTAVFTTELPQCLLDQQGLLLLQKSIGRSGTRVNWFVSESFQRLIRGDFRPSLAMAISDAMHGNSVQPRVEGALALERMQLEIGLDEGILHDVLGFLKVPDHVGDTGEQPILMQLHESAEGVRVAMLSLFNQWSFIIHGSSRHGTPNRGKAE